MSRCCCNKIGVRLPQPMPVGVEGPQTYPIGVGYIPTKVIAGGSGAVEQWLLMPDACGLTVIPSADIIAEAEAQWANPTDTPDHSQTLIHTLDTDKSGAFVEDYLQIPDQYLYYAMSKTDILNCCNEIYNILIN